MVGEYKGKEKTPKRDYFMFVSEKKKREGGVEKKDETVSRGRVLACGQKKEKRPREGKREKYNSLCVERDQYARPEGDS